MPLLYNFRMSKIVKFNNGLRLVLQNISHSRAIAIGVSIGVGSSFENNKTNGLAHFTEHMLFKGTKTRSAFDIVNYLEMIGVNINAYTSKEQTMYYTLSSFEYMEQCLEVLSDIFFNSTFNENEIEKEKGVIIEEINADLDNPESVCVDNLAKAYYGEKNYGLKILGNIENIKKYNSQDFVEFVKNFYTSDNVVISIAGKLDEEKSIALVDKYFNRNFVNTKKLERSTDINLQFDSQVFIKDTKQANIAVAFPTYSAMENSYIHTVFNNLTTGGMSSRLFQKIREELGLVYDISLYALTYKNCGNMVLYLGTSNSLATKALDSIREELDNIKSCGFTEDELKKGKEQVKLKIMLMQEQAMSVMRANASKVVLFDKSFNIDKELEKLNEITLLDLLDYANKYIDYNKMASSYVGSDIKLDVLSSFK